MRPMVSALSLDEVREDLDGEPRSDRGHDATVTPSWKGEGLESGYLIAFGDMPLNSEWPFDSENTVPLKQDEQDRSRVKGMLIPIFCFSMKSSHHEQPATSASRSKLEHSVVL